MKTLKEILIICIFLFDVVSVFDNDSEIGLFAKSCANILSRILVIILLIIIQKQEIEKL